MRVQPRTHGPRLHSAAANVEPLVRLWLRRRQRRKEPVPEHSELEVVEQTMDTLTVPRGQHELLRRVRQLDVADQLSEMTVAQHYGQVLPQRIPYLAAYLVDAVHQLVQRAVLTDPLRGRLLSH